MNSRQQAMFLLNLKYILADFSYLNVMQGKMGGGGSTVASILEIRGSVAGILETRDVLCNSGMSHC